MSLISVLHNKFSFPLEDPNNKLKPFKPSGYYFKADIATASISNPPKIT